MALQTADVPYAFESQSMTGYAAWDDATAGRRPAVLVFHGGAGLDEHARDRTRRMARLGYLAMAADLYGDAARGMREAIMATIGRFQREPAYLRAVAQTALTQVVAHPLCAGPCATIGYCLGGMTALELARSGADLRATISVHGSLHSAAPAAPGVIRGTVLVCHGAIDPHVPMAQVNGFVDEMNRAGADWQLHVYGQAMHGFTHDQGGPAAPGVAYDATADARSSATIAALLRVTLG